MRIRGCDRSFVMTLEAPAVPRRPTEAGKLRATLNALDAVR
jgi:hypothetical protein